MDYISVSNLRVAPPLHRFVEHELLPASGIESAQFWSGLADAVSKYGPRNASLLAHRDVLQSQIDDYYRKHVPVDAGHYRAFLAGINYLLPEPNEFQVATSKVDDEIARIA